MSIAFNLNRFVTITMGTREAHMLIGALQAHVEMLTRTNYHRYATVDSRMVVASVAENSRNVFTSPPKSRTEEVQQSKELANNLSEMIKHMRLIVEGTIADDPVLKRAISVDTDEQLQLLELERIKNDLLKYLLEAVSDSWDHLTPKERAIVGDEDTFNALIKHLGIEGSE